MSVKMNKSGSVRAAAVKIPVKRTINLASAGVKKMNMKAAVIGIVLIIAAAVLFSKFAVVDRLIAMNRANSRTAQMQKELTEGYAKIASYGDVETEYAHYTLADMTDEELSLVSRTDIVSMIEKEVPGEETAVSWSVRGNVLTLNVYGESLQEFNRLARNLEKYDIVSLCTVTTAVMDDKEAQELAEAGKVRANITVYLQNTGEGEDE